MLENRRSDIQDDIDYEKEDRDIERGNYTEETGEDDGNEDEEDKII